MKMSRVAMVAFGFLGLCTASCREPTSFRGEAQFPGGALGCFKQCQKVGMDMASYVYVGEYSTACACKPKIATATATGPAADLQDEVDSNEASVVAAAAGVELQRRRIDEEEYERRQREYQQKNKAP